MLLVSSASVSVPTLSCYEVVLTSIVGIVARIQHRVPTLSCYGVVVPSIMKGNQTTLDLAVDALKCNWQSITPELQYLPSVYISVVHMLTPAEDLQRLQL